MFGYVDLESFINIVKAKTGLRLNIAAIERHRSSGFFVVGLMYETYFSPLPSHVKITDTETKVLYTDWRLLTAKDDERYSYIVNDEFSLDVGDERRPYSFIEDDLVILVSHVDTFVSWLLSKKSADEKDVKQASANPVQDNKLDESEVTNPSLSPQKENETDEKDVKQASAISAQENKQDENEVTNPPHSPQKENETDEKGVKQASANPVQDNKLDENEVINPSLIPQKENKTDEKDVKQASASSAQENKQDENEVTNPALSPQKENETDGLINPNQLFAGQRKGELSEILRPIAIAYYRANACLLSKSNLILELGKQEYIDRYGYILHANTRELEFAVSGKKIKFTDVIKSYKLLLRKAEIELAKS